MAVPGGISGMRLSIPSAALAALLLAACGDGGPTVVDLVDLPTAEVQAGVVAPGAGQWVTISNGGTLTFTHGSCNVAVDRLEANRWVTVRDDREPVCTADLRTLAPGAQRTERVLAPMEEGTYRLRHFWNAPGGGQPVQSLSGSFVVLADGFVALQPLLGTVVDGDSIPIRITNLTTHEWTYDLCVSGRFQRLVGAAWADAPLPLALCAPTPATLAAAATVDRYVTVPTGYAAGTYRYTATFARTGATAHVVASSIFTVQ